MERPKKRLVFAFVLALLAVPRSSFAHCEANSGRDAAATLGVSLASGIVSALVSAGITSLVNDDRDYGFWKGALSGSGVAFGSALIAHMMVHSCSSEARVIVPISVAAVSAVVPVLVWRLSGPRTSSSAIDLGMIRDEAARSSYPPLRPRGYNPALR